ncbi:MAG: RHS repeat-associated core domain-containing protein [Geobacteraceae bacterium]|nr:RHS repeat-associated core domain-containing protein [Geobacteraceae bacterium]
MFEAARIGDEISHTSKLGGLVAGMLLGALIAAAILFTIGTGGLGAAVIIGALCTGAAVGGAIGQLLGGLNKTPKGFIATGAKTVIFEGKPAARACVDTADCRDHGRKLIATGIFNVLIEGYPAATVGDQGECSFEITKGSSTILIGGERSQCPGIDIHDEVPAWLQWLHRGLGLLGAFLLLLPCGALRAILSVAMGEAGSRFLGDFGNKHFGKWGGVAGTIVGGMLGGGIGFKSPDIARYLKSTTSSLAAKLKAPSVGAVLGDPVNAITGEVLEEQADFTLPGLIPLTWTRRYGSLHAEKGVCGLSWQTPADARLTMDESGAVLFLDGSPSISLFDRLPEQAPIMEAIGGAVLSLKGEYYQVRTIDGLTYHFGKTAGDTTELPVERITDDTGNSLRFTRDENGLSRIESSSGSVIVVNSHGFLIHAMQLVTDGEEPKTLVNYRYSEDGELLAATDPLGASCTFTYEDRRMTSHTDRNGLAFLFRYDETGRCVHTKGDGGLHEYNFFYNLPEKITQAKNAEGHVTTIRYDDNNLLLEKTDPLGNTTSYEYNERHLPEAVTDPLGRRTEYHYNEAGQPTLIVRPDGTKLEIAYDGRNRPREATDPNGGTWKQTWSSDGLLTSRETPLGAKTTYRYHADGRLAEATDPLGAKTLIQTNAHGDITAVTDPLGNSTSYQRDVLGNILEATLPSGAKTTYHYDAASRLVRVIRPGGAEVHLSYDAEGNLACYRDELGHETRMEYTGIGELAKRINPDGTTVTYRYDGEERLVSVSNERGETIRIRRDKAGRITGQTDYRGNLTRYAWNAAGMLAQKIDPLGTETSYQHDPLGRITETLFSDGTKEEYHYDANDNLVHHRNKSITVARTFDAEGRLTRETQGDFFVESEYDVAGRRTKRTSSHGNTVEFAYDPVGNLSGITINGKTVSGIDRNNLGLPTRETLPNNINKNYRYDIQGRLLTESLFGAPQRWEREYRYDNAGNLITRKDPRFGESSFSYDPMGRVKQATDPEGKIHHFLHDPAGDLLRKEEIESGDRSLEYQDNTYRFNAAGNLVRREGRKNSTWYTWDSTGRLTEALHTNCARTTLRYDALGRRISKETDGRKTDFYWDGERLLSDTRYREAPREYVYYPDTFVPFAAIEGNGNIRYYNNDIAGLPQEVRDEEGNILWQARYDALGRVVRLKGSHRFDNPLRLQGQYYDEELDLCYNRYRYFDPLTCSFISKDPLGLAAGTNLYAYAPNVWGWVDPLGLCKGATSGIPEYTFRGDTRVPAEIFNGGFQPRGTNTDLLGYARHNDPSVFVGTSTSPKTAGGFAGEGGYVYTVRPGSNAVDVNASLGRMSPFPHETEIAVPGGISPSDIMGARQIGSVGLTGPFIKNPNYIPN